MVSLLVVAVVGLELEIASQVDLQAEVWVARE